MPLISLLTVVTNGVWFFVLAPLDAFVYATIFHGIQYIAIVIVFLASEQSSYLTGEVISVSSQRA